MHSVDGHLITAFDATDAPTAISDYASFPPLILLTTTERGNICLIPHVEVKHTYSHIHIHTENRWKEIPSPFPKPVSNFQKCPMWSSQDTDVIMYVASILFKKLKLTGFYTDPCSLTRRLEDHMNDKWSFINLSISYIERRWNNTFSLKLLTGWCSLSVQTLFFT